MCGTGTAYPSGAHELIPVFSGICLVFRDNTERHMQHWVQNIERGQTKQNNTLRKTKKMRNTDSYKKYYV
jgi:hypothetical protein